MLEKLRGDKSKGRLGDSEYIRQTTNSQVFRDQALPSPNEFFDNIGGEYFLGEDEKLLEMMDPESPSFIPFLEPLRPLFSRLNSFTNISKETAELYGLEIYCECLRLKSRVKGFHNKSLVRNVSLHLRMKLHDSINGFKIGKLTTKSREVSFRPMSQEKKRRF